MAGAVEGSSNIKEALYEALSAVLSVDQQIRNTGEEQMKALEVTEGMPCYFSSVSPGYTKQGSAAPGAD